MPMGQYISFLRDCELLFVACSEPMLTLNMVKVLGRDVAIFQGAGRFYEGHNQSFMII
ncbi:hypothetical protein D3C74_173480 [compost metagenome]